ncbi:MAG: TspO/MBR family protein [Hyphomicrobiaceae bacterium]
MTEYLEFASFFALVFVTASTGAIFAPGAWYESLDKPSWTPPNWAFPVVWGTLYIMIAIAGWLVWTSEGFGLAIAFWGANLVFNAAWSWIMFGMKRIGLALADAILMLITILGFIAAAWPVSQTAALLFLPYLAWVVTAIALNYDVLRRNPNASAVAPGR